MSDEYEVNVVGEGPAIDEAPVEENPLASKRGRKPKAEVAEETSKEVVTVTFQSLSGPRQVEVSAHSLRHEADRILRSGFAFQDGPVWRIVPVTSVIDVCYPFVKATPD